MHNAEALRSYTAAELAARIAVGSIDPVDVVQLSERHDGALAVETQSRHVAQCMAAQRKRERDRGELLGPLHGVPVAVYLPQSAAPAPGRAPDAATSCRAALTRAGAIIMPAGSADMAASAALSGDVAAAIAVADDPEAQARRHGLFSFSPTTDTPRTGPSAAGYRLAGFARSADDLPLLHLYPVDAGNTLRLTRKSWRVGVAKVAGRAATAPADKAFLHALAQIADAGVALVDIDLASRLTLRRKWNEGDDLERYQVPTAVSAIAVAPRRGRDKDNTPSLLEELFQGLDTIVVPGHVRYDAVALDGLPRVYIPTSSRNGLVIIGRPGTDVSVLNFARYAEAAFHCMEAAA